MDIGQKTQARDFAQALVGEHGTFLVSKPGSQPLLVICEEGHSIKSVRSVGAAISIPLAVNSDWEIEKVNESTQVPEELGGSGYRRDEERRRQEGRQATNR